MIMTKREILLCLEALRTARCEIEAMEETFDDYAASDRLINQLKEGERILVQEKAKLL